MPNRKTLISLSVHANAKVFLGTSKQKQLKKTIVSMYYEADFLPITFQKSVLNWNRANTFRLICQNLLRQLEGRNEVLGWMTLCHCMRSIYAINEIQSIKEKILWTDKYLGDDYLCKWWLFHKIDTYKSYEMSFSIFIRMLSYFGHCSCYKIVKYFHFPKQIHFSCHQIIEITLIIKLSTCVLKTELKDFIK